MSDQIWHGERLAICDTVPLSSVCINCCSSCILHVVLCGGSNQIMMTSSNGNAFRVIGPLWGNLPFTGGFPSQRLVTWSFGVFFNRRWTTVWVNNRNVVDLTQTQTQTQTWFIQRKIIQIQNISGHQYIKWTYVQWKGKIVTATTLLHLPKTEGESPPQSAATSQWRPLRSSAYNGAFLT